MDNSSLYLDIRLQERAIRMKRLTRPELEASSSALPDRAENVVEFDADGNATNLPRRKLKVLPVKPGEPESALADGSLPGDMLDAWEEGPDL